MSFLLRSGRDRFDDAKGFEPGELRGERSIATRFNSDATYNVLFKEHDDTPAASCASAPLGGDRLPAFPPSLHAKPV
jgi:hypothetical protein